MLRSALKQWRQQDFKGNLVESIKLVYNCFIEQKKKKGKIVFGCSFYGRFLRTKMINRPTTIMATNRPAIAGAKY